MNKKLSNIGISISILIIIGLLSYNRNFIQEKDPHLTLEERDLVEKRLQEGQKELTKAKNNDDKFNASMQIGFDYYVLGKYKDSKESFIKGRKLKPKSHIPYVALYQVEVDMNDVRSARKSIKKAIALQERNPDLWKKYIQLEADLFAADDNELKKLYIEALTKTGSHIDLLAFYAQFLEKTGDIQSAIDYFEKAHALNPTDPLYEKEIQRLKILL